MQAFGWKGAMLITAAIVLVIILFGCLMKPLKHQETAQEEKVARTGTSAENKVILL